VLVVGRETISFQGRKGMLQNVIQQTGFSFKKCKKLRSIKMEQNNYVEGLLHKATTKQHSKGYSTAYMDTSTLHGMKVLAK
jgi:hypothetical protein